MTVTLLIACVFGLSVGCLLSLVIVRVPIPSAGEVAVAGRPGGAGDLAEDPLAPGSRGARPLRWSESIPLQGMMVPAPRRTKHGVAVRRRFPAVEAASALAAVGAIASFGVTWQALAAVAFVSVLIVLSAIDLEHQVLPDLVVLPTLWLGLGVSCLAIFANADEAILGAGAGYASLWATFHAYRALTGKDALGHGDFKLMAMIGAWLGISAIPIVLLVAFPLGAVIGLALMGLGRARLDAALPFGPMLAVGAAAALFGEEAIYQFLLDSAI